MLTSDLCQYEFTSLEEVREFIGHCPDHVQPILWVLYLATLQFATEENKHVIH